MAELDSIPIVPAHGKEIVGAALEADEKGSGEKYSSGSIEIAASIQGDVYDDIRAIDMGEDGKERPIGT